MGAGASKGGVEISDISPTLDRKAILRETSKPAYIMNRIFKYITEEFTEKDLFKLQDEATCREFLILGADSLQHFFTEIKLQPTADKAGKIFFAKVSDITNPRDEEDKQIVRNNCLALSYFYVRLLQIYVALGLTLIDNASLIPGERRYIQQRRPVTIGTQRLAPGAAVSFGSPGLRGGAMPQTITAAELGLLSKGPQSQPWVGVSDSKQGKALRGQSGGKLPEMIYVGSGKGQKGGAQPFTFDELVRVGILTTTLGGNRYSVHGYPNLTIIGSGTSGTLIDNNYVAQQQQQQPYGGMYGRTQVIQPSISFNLMTAPDGRPVLQISQLTSPQQDKTLTNIGINIFLRPDSYEPQDSDVPILPELFKTIMDEWTSGNASTLTSLKERTSRRSIGGPMGPRTSALDYESSISALKAKPLAHCMARSFQLLQIDALGPKIPKAARSYICNTKFVQESLKTPALGQGDPITKIPGLGAFNFLFFVLEKSVQLSERTREEYERTIKQLATLYSDKAPEFDVGAGTAMMSQVKYSKPGCQVRDKDIILQGESVKRARKGVATLWAYQVEHAKRVEVIFRKLFRIEKSPSGQIGISINPLLIAKGIPAIEYISAEARKLLLDYYSNCESIYQTTVAGLQPGL